MIYPSLLESVILAVFTENATTNKRPTIIKDVFPTLLLLIVTPFNKPYKFNIRRYATIIRRNDSTLKRVHDSPSKSTIK